VQLHEECGHDAGHIEMLTLPCAFEDTMLPFRFIGRLRQLGDQFPFAVSQHEEPLTRLRLSSPCGDEVLSDTVRSVMITESEQSDAHLSTRGDLSLTAARLSARPGRSAGCKPVHQ